MLTRRPPLNPAVRPVRPGPACAGRAIVFVAATPSGGGDGEPNSPPAASTPTTPSPGPLPNPLADPSAVVLWGGRLPSRRRLLTSTAAATAIVLGGNLGGVTSALLSSSETATAAARAARLDIILPVRGTKRCAPPGAGFEFTYPAAWLADRTVAERRAAAGERARSLDPPSLKGGRAGGASPLPDVAFGPPDTAGETNVSVIVAPIMAGFTLAGSLGPPKEAGEKFLATVIAPPGGPRTATLISASERSDASSSGGTVYYEWEYRVVGPGFDRTNVSCLAARRVRPGGRLELVTLNAQAPTADFDADAGLRTALRASSASLVVVDRVADGTGGRGL